MSQDPTTYEHASFLEGLTAHSLSDWLPVGPHYVNMSQAEYVEEDVGAREPTSKLYLSSGRRHVLTGADRLAVLAWLAQQVAPPAGG